MRKILLTLLATLSFLLVFGQDLRIRQVEKDLKEHTRADTFRVNRLNELPRLLTLPIGRVDTVTSEALAISKKLNYPEGQTEALINAARLEYRKNNLPKTWELLQQAVNIAENLKDKTYLSDAYSAFQHIKGLTGETQQALAYAIKAEAMAETTQNKSLIANRQVDLSSLYTASIGDYSKAMDWALKGEKNAEELNNLDLLAKSWSTMAAIYTPIGDKENALLYYKKALDANKKLGNKALEFNLLNRIGEMYRLTGKYADALKAYQEGLTKTQMPYNIELTESNMADVYVRLGEVGFGFEYAFRSLNTAKSINDTEGEEWIDGILARAYLKEGKPDSALYYSNIGYSKSLKTGTIEFKRDNAEALANAYVLKKDFVNAYKYHILYIAYRDSMSSAEITNQTNLLQYNYDLAKKQAQIAGLNQDKRVQYAFLIGALVVLVIIGITLVILARNNRQKQKANILLSKQKKIIEEQRDETNKALADLRLTQKQLIQSEKMASLGELTAGIAHEIQNPLNFVNNFSEVNLEMIDEMEKELKAGNIEEALSISADIKQNEEKISHHGKRADGIVKGMLQHSRASSDVKEPTDINKLADEYLRLAYHGLRAKEKSFNAELITHFDNQLPMAGVVPQDIGRVLLNLFTNAFYSVQQKQKAAGAGYKPTVELGTYVKHGMINITVKDNGMGIPEHIKDKIMQPFFTTKPTGEGTGLGLSMSYDIVVKGHSGDIVINTEEGNYTEFTVKIPV